jgi:hypothetical protein
MCPPLTTTYCGPNAWMARAASSISAIVPTGRPLNADASRRLGLATSARGSKTFRSATTASGRNMTAPLLAIITGSTTNRSIRCSRRPRWPDPYERLRERLTTPSSVTDVSWTYTALTKPGHDGTRIPTFMRYLRYAPRSCICRRRKQTMLSPHSV